MQARIENTNVRRGSQLISAMKHSRRGERGIAMLEFALTLPMLLLLGVGVVDVGRAIYYTVEVNNGATAGAEYGAQSWVTGLQTADMQSAATNDGNITGMTATATYGCTCDTGAGTSCSYPVPVQNSCFTMVCTGGQMVMCDQVTTHATITPIFPFPGLPAKYEANGRAVMRVRR